MPIDTLDLVADHLIIAHSLIEEGDGTNAMLLGVRMALLEVGLALAARTQEAIAELTDHEGSSSGGRATAASSRVYSEVDQQKSTQPGRSPGMSARGWYTGRFRFRPNPAV
ncbi:hypothetical protein Q8W71_26185 [Methylobacterium sp. NEAU 140]|uniref:hypothetical protein n=1 Tax=Methylobacterium sp. NEAU 140 TaxID=3064945 RepID=UPI0027332A5F|nr:hypothetical protein [Methylobacterium sp. NEAU 140]MDP4026121.1 hypothetical protein [Methylobacterium sp. NEAU 140]